LARVSEAHLDELRQLDDDDALPGWAETIGVPDQSTSDYATFSDISLEVRKLVGTQIQQSEPGVDVATILDRVIDEEPLFGVETSSGYDPSPALLAVLWGLCRAGVFRVTTVDDNPVELDALLSPSRHTTLTLSTVPTGKRAKDIFVEHDIIEPTESENQGYINFAEQLETIETRASGLASNSSVKADTTFETEGVNTLVERLATEAKEIEEAAAERREAVTSVDTEQLEEMIEAAENHDDILTMAETHWDERLPFFLQLEGLTRPELREVEWLGEDVHDQLQALTEQVETASETDWWTDDGWTAFVGVLDARQPALTALEEAWGDQQAKTAVDSLQADLEGHPWLQQPRDLPTTVRDGFRVAYLDPLRTFRTTVEHITTVVEDLTDPEPSTNDKSALTTTLGRLDGRLDWDALSTETVEQRREQLAKVDRLVDGKEPGDLTEIGLLQADADVLRTTIEELEEADIDLDLIDADGGVIVR
jgi:hypothetical protein